MSRRVPLLPTLIVLAAVLAMVRLGVWQLHRRHEKASLVARYAANVAAPPIALPALREKSLFRRVAGECLQPVGWTVEAGRSATGESGWRHIADCRTGAGGPGFAADLGVSRSQAAPAWHGGPIAGRLTYRPDHRPLVARLFGPAPAREPMIVATAPAPGLAASAQPDPAAIPNNHLAYAVQWFAFAGVALVIYAVALLRRGRSVAPERPHR